MCYTFINASFAWFWILDLLLPHVTVRPKFKDAVVNLIVAYTNWIGDKFRDLEGHGNRLISECSK